MTIKTRLIKDANFRPSEWHIALVRDSLIRAAYPPSSHRHVQEILRQKAERKMGKQSSYRRRVIQQYGLVPSGQHVYGDRVWNIASAGWEPKLQVSTKRKTADLTPDTTGATEDELSSGLLQVAHIVPQCFGKKLFRRIFGDRYHDEDFWAADNGLLLPRGVAAALDDWSISVVPANDHRPAQDFAFRVINPADENLGRRITFATGDYRTGRDLDGAKLSFLNLFRPRLNYLYFNHCCAIVKKNRDLFRDPATDGFIVRFRKAEQERIQLEGGEVEVQRRPFTPNYDLQAFWSGMLEDLVRMDQEPNRVHIDWSMSLRYLKNIDETLDDTAIAPDNLENVC